MLCFFVMCCADPDAGCISDGDAAAACGWGASFPNPSADSVGSAADSQLGLRYACACCAVSEHVSDHAVEHVMPATAGAGGMGAGRLEEPEQ
jgi:hypothetical protein